ncbi:MAG: hypothetical protein DRI28_01550 [Caldiserica bacterium]|nr:MAG: hypothetical protein DRI28_01550 [Caldisericota bacterium]
MNKVSKLVFFTLIFLIILTLSYAVSKHFIAGKEKYSYVKLKIAIPNIYPEVAESIKEGDYIIDKQGNRIFKIESVFIKPAEHPVETCDGRIVKAEHPIYKSAIITVKTVKPTKSLIVGYNRRTARIGAKLVIETPKVRFVGVVLSVEKGD